MAIEGFGFLDAVYCAVDSDAADVYITLLARARNPDLLIIGRASSPESVEALTRAGGNRVVSRYRLSGTPYGRPRLSPGHARVRRHGQRRARLRVEELVVGERTPLAGATVRETAGPYDGVMILAVRSPERRPAGAAPSRHQLAAGDLLIVVGPMAALDRLAERAR